LINQLPIAPFEMAKKQMIAHAEATLKNTSDKAAVADTVLNTQLGRWAAAKGAKAAGLSMGVPFAGDVASKALLDPTIGKMIGKGATFISQGTKTINESGGVKGGIQSITQAIEKQFKSADKSSEKTSYPSAPTNNKPKQP
nr:hypothetical protein [Gammaproteobacteria bacterium]